MAWHPAWIECGGTAANRPFRAVFNVLTGWDARGGQVFIDVASPIRL